MSLDHKGNLAKLARSLCLTQHFIQPPSPPPPPKMSERALARKTYAEIFQKPIDSPTLMGMLCHILIEFVRLSSIFVQDPKIVGPDQLDF